MIANTPQAPYYAVIFTSERTEIEDGYNETADRMVELASEQPGFLGVETARNENVITVFIFLASGYAVTRSLVINVIKQKDIP